VEQVSWNDIQPFCTNNGLRLPTEAEWEFAYRAGTFTAFHGWSVSPEGTNDDNQVANIAWFSGNSGGETRPVAGRAANGFGLYDMSGNVWEWCKDVWSSDSNVLPGDGTPLNAGDSSYHAVRGGSWNNNSSNCRCARRNRNNYWYDNQGFRVVLLDLSGVSGVSL